MMRPARKIMVRTYHCNHVLAMTRVLVLHFLTYVVEHPQ